MLVLLLSRDLKQEELAGLQTVRTSKMYNGLGDSGDGLSASQIIDRQVEFLDGIVLQVDGSAEPSSAHFIVFTHCLGIGSPRSLSTWPMLTCLSLSGIRQWSQLQNNSYLNLLCYCHFRAQGWPAHWNSSKNGDGLNVNLHLFFLCTMLLGCFLRFKEGEAGKRKGEKEMDRRNAFLFTQSACDFPSTRAYHRRQGHMSSQKTPPGSLPYCPHPPYE